MSNIDPVVGVAELKIILGGVSTATIYRWKADNTLPPVIDLGGSGKRRRLIWSRDSIIAFLSNQNRGSPRPLPNDESAASRAKRHRRAIESLAAQAVKVDIPAE